MTGWVVSTNPSGWNPKAADRLPSWKIQTSAPKLATIESVFITRALIGRMTERSRTNSTRYVVTTMNRSRPREVGGHAIHDVGDVRRAASDEHADAGRRGERAGGVAHRPDEGASLVAVGAVRRGDRERGHVPLGRRRQALGHVPVARAVRVAVEQLVLRERQPRIDVDEAVDPLDPRVGREAARVVVQRGEVRRLGRGTGRPDREHDRGELALAEVRLEAVEGGPGRDLGRQDRGVGRVEPHVEERRAEDEEQREGRDEDGDRVAHHPSSEPRPRALGVGMRVHLPDRESVDPVAEDRQDRGQQRQRRQARQPDDDGAGDADRAQDHELEEDQAEQAQQDGQPAEEHRPTRRGDRDADGVGHAVGAGRSERQLLAEPARHAAASSRRRGPRPRSVARLSTKMLIGVTDATRKMLASATSTAVPPTMSGTPAATADPNTTSSASAASGSEMTSLRRRSDSETVWTSP